MDGVPEAFGVIGLYVLAASTETPNPLDFSDEDAFPPEVIYIGTSTHVEQRLERHHGAVSRYRKNSSDAQCQKLWFSYWHSEWSHDKGHQKPMPLALASVAFHERALLLAYVVQYGRYPILNLR